MGNFLDKTGLSILWEKIVAKINSKATDTLNAAKQDATDKDTALKTSIETTAANTYLSKTDAGNTYVTKTTFNALNGDDIPYSATNSLTITEVVDGLTSTKLSKTDASATYETKANAITGLSVSGKTITYTKGDGSTGTITTQDTTYSNATASTAGLIKVSSVNSSAVTVNSESTTSGRYYPIELNNDGKAIVNVPWKNDNTTYTISVASGGNVITLTPSSGTAQSITIDNVANASSATKATQDGSGNVITDTYLTKSSASSTYLTKTDASSTYATKDELSAAVSSAMHYKGSVASYSNLPTSPTLGDLYNVTDTGKNYAWNGTEWDELSGVMDLSDYLTKSDASSTYLSKTDASSTYATKTAIANMVTSSSTLTANKIVIGNGNKTVKASSYGITTSAPASGDNTNVPTSGAIVNYVTGICTSITEAEIDEICV